MKRRNIVLATVMSGLLATPVMGAVTVRALARGLEPVRDTMDVRLVHAADFTTDRQLRIGQVLERGDRLASDARGLVVELECGDAIRTVLSGSFDVIVEETRGAGCALDLKNGALDFLTETSTLVNVGGIVLGNEGTQYAVRYESGGSSAVVLVFDGKVRLRGGRGKKKVKTGKFRRVELSGDISRARELGESHVILSAEAYARADVALAVAGGIGLTSPESAYAHLKALHADVLLHPRSLAARRALAEAQEGYGIGDEAQYHLQRAKKIKRGRIGKGVLAAVAAAAAAAVIADQDDDDREDQEDQEDEPREPPPTPPPGDTVPPEVTITSMPPESSPNTDARFTFIASERATFTCRLDAGEIEPCSSPQSYTELAVGSHTFTVYATDESGNTGSASYRWTSYIIE